LYVRANTCVACHQTLDPEIAAAGHPELIFELSGQTVTQPKHWREADDNTTAKQWLVGQAVALREMSWQLAHLQRPEQSLVARWQGLVWTLKTAAANVPAAAPLQALNDEVSAENFTRVHEASDKAANSVAKTTWNVDAGAAIFKKLAATGIDFGKNKGSNLVQARRAERLVVALDRLAPRPQAKGSGHDERLSELFTLAQSIPGFDPDAFSTALARLSSEIKP
jgi:hypothetical protein